MLCNYISTLGHDNLLIITKLDGLAYIGTKILTKRYKGNKQEREKHIPCMELLI